MNERINCIKQESVEKYISIIYRAVNVMMEKQLKNYDIDRGQFPFLIPLYQREALSQNELCRFYNMDKAAAVRALNKLEENGYVERKKDPDDKRQHQVYLTKKGKNFEIKLSDIINYTESKMLQNLEEEEKIQLITLLRKISDGLE